MVAAPNLAVELELARTLVLARSNHLANDLLPVVLRDHRSRERFRVKVERVFEVGQGMILRCSNSYECVVRRIRYLQIFRG